MRPEIPIINAEKDSRLRQKDLFWKFVNKVLCVYAYVCVKHPILYRARAREIYTQGV